MKLIDFIWSRVTATVGTVGLAVISLSGDMLEAGWFRSVIDEYRAIMVTVLAIFLIVHSYKNWRREQAYSRRIAGNFENIQNNVLHLISDLSDLVGKQYHLWIVDLYVTKRVLQFSLRWPFVFGQILEKKLSVSLSEVSDMPTRITRNNDLLGHVISKNGPTTWWDSELVETYISSHNASDDLPEATNANLKRHCGVLKVWPITDDLKSDCRGILVIHAKRDSEVATAALGVLAGGQADRLCFRTGLNIHGQLGD